MEAPARCSFAVGHAGGGDGEHPVAGAVDEVDPAAGGALEVAVHQVRGVQDAGDRRQRVKGMSAWRPHSRV
jgi:hypothetical protein